MKVDLDMQQQTITVDGVCVSLDVLRIFAHPDPLILYRMERKGNVTHVESLDRSRLSAVSV